MKGKTVVITGGTSRIGEIAAERLAQMGDRIVATACAFLIDTASRPAKRHSARTNCAMLTPSFAD